MQDEEHTDLSADSSLVSTAPQQRIRGLPNPHTLL